MRIMFFEGVALVDEPEKVWHTRIMIWEGVALVKGIFQPFELGGVTRLIPSAVKFCEAGHLKKIILMIQSHERA